MGRSETLPLTTAATPEVAGAASLTCRFCGETLAFYRELRPPFALYGCPSCETVTTYPQPSAHEVDVLYREHYDAELGTPFARQLRRQREVLARIERHVTRGALLDVGCAGGHFLHYARKQGWQVAGLEPNRVLAQRARETLGLEVVAGTVEEMPAILREREFDVVYLSHVLEHLLAPERALATLRALLTPTGVLVVRVPNLDCLLFRLLGRHYIELYPSGHLYHFTRRTLAHLLQQEGYVLAEMRTRQCDFAHEGFVLVKGLLDALGLYEEVCPTSIGNAEPEESAYRRRVWARRLLWPLYAVTLPVWVLSARLGLGYEIFAVARVK